MTQREMLISNAVSFGMSLGFGCSVAADQAINLKQFDLLIKAIGQYQHAKIGNQAISEHAIYSIAYKVNVLVEFSTSTRSITVRAKFPYGFEPDLHFPSSIVNDNSMALPIEHTTTTIRPEAE